MSHHTVRELVILKFLLFRKHERDNCLKTARGSNNADDWSNYRVARNKAVAMIRSAKRKFFCNAFKENKGNSREIWKTIRTLTRSGKNRRDINSINIGEAVIDDQKLMAQHFNAHFSSIADRKDLHYRKFHQTPQICKTLSDPEKVLIHLMWFHPSLVRKCLLCYKN